MVLVYFESNLLDMLSDTWWLNNGVTIHTINSLHELRNSRRPIDIKLVVNMSNGLKIKVKHISTIKLILAFKHALNLFDTAFIPFMRKKLIFDSILDKCRYVFHFRNRYIIIFYNSIMLGYS